jgi:hypothetical protein
MRARNVDLKRAGEFDAFIGTKVAKLYDCYTISRQLDLFIYCARRKNYWAELLPYGMIVFMLVPLSDWAHEHIFGQRSSLTGA